MWSLLPIEGGEVELGRDTLATRVQDARISRRHARVFLRDGRFHAVDLGSLNGTAADGKLLSPHAAEPVERCLRVGGTLFLVVGDVRRLEREAITVHGGRVIGPHLLRAYLKIARLAHSTPTVHLHGESGVGKEDAARTFHAATTKSAGPFVPVNCATIPESIAERLLFGAKRGAFSGAAADSQGYVQAADGGTLFLDEVAELHSAVQAKLLRVLENQEVHVLGAVRPMPVDIRVCSASHVPLHSLVASGRLREDLYYRIGRPEIVIPSLCQRLEEIPWLIHGELQKMPQAPQPHFSFVEACLLRSWPGNIRELLVEVRTAAQEAVADGSSRIEVKHLGALAGQVVKVPAPLPQSPPTERPVAPPPESPPAEPPPKADPKRAEVEAVLLQTGGNVSTAARALGMPRTALRRLLLRYQLDPTNLPGIIKARRKVTPK